MDGRLSEGTALADLLPVLDSRPLQDLLDMGAGPGLVQELIGLLKGDLPLRLANLRIALGNLDGATATQEVHQMKGALGNMGLQRAADLAGRTEDHLRAGRWDSAKILAEALPAAYEEALAALLAAFPEG